MVLPRRRVLVQSYIHKMTHTYKSLVAHRQTKYGKRGSVFARGENKLKKNRVNCLYL